MAIQGYSTEAGRINVVKGEILAHAIPVEVLGITGQQKRHPKNKGDTQIFRRWLPFGATESQPNQWDVDPNEHLLQEGVTPPADTLKPQDISVTLQQYHVLYSYTDKTADLYEDDVPAEMKIQTGERCGLVREMVRYGVLKGMTNRHYQGGSSRSAVDNKVSLGALRRITRGLRGNHGKFITRVLDASPKFATRGVEASYLVFSHTDTEADFRDLPGFKVTAEYGSRRPISDYELGSVENFRIILSPHLEPYPDAGGDPVTNNLVSTSGSSADVYPIIITAEDAWGQVALRGMNAIDDITDLRPGQKDKNDPHGQRGYFGAKFWFATTMLNDGWAAVYEVGVSDLD